MEGEKYNLTKAQEEADKLRKKVESGDAPDYGEAEKLLERKTTNDPVNEYQKKKLNEFKQKLFAGDYSSVISSLNYDLSGTYDEIYDLNKSPYLADFIKTPEAKSEFQKKEFIDFLVEKINGTISQQHDNHKNLVKLLNLFDLLDISELLFQREEIGGMGQRALLNCVSGAYKIIEDTTRIIDKFNIPQSFIESDEVKKLVIDKRINFSCDKDRYKYADNETKQLNEVRKLQTFFKIPDEVIKEKVIKAVLDSINGNYDFDKEYFLKLKQFFNIDIPDERIQDGVKQIILKRLAEGAYRLEGIEKTIKNTGIPLSIIQSEEISQSVKIKMIESLGYGNGESFDQYREIFQIPESTINSQEFRSAWINGAVRNLQSVFSGLTDRYEPNFIRSNESIVKFKICVPFGDELMESPEVQNAIKENFLRLQEYIDPKRLIVVVDFLPESIKSSPEIQGHIQKVINYILRGSDFIPAINLTHAFDLPEMTVNEIYLPKIIKLLQESKKSLSEIVEVVEYLRPAESFYKSQELKSTIAKKVAQCISSGNFDEAVIFQEKFKVDFGEVQDVAKGEATKKLSSGSIEDFLKIIAQFRIDPENIKQIDKDNSEKLSENNLIKFIPLLGGAEASKLLPLTLGTAQEMIFAKLATDQDLADYFVENLDKYYQQPWVVENVAKAIQQYSVAQKFIYAVENDQTVWKNEIWVVDILAKAKVIVEGHKKQFPQGDDEQGDSYGYSHGSQGFRESDPFANHPCRFGGRQIRIASAISEMMAGKVNSQELEKLGINSNEISASLAEVNEKINTAYQNFLEQIRSNTSIKEDDKQAFLDPESSGVKMTPLLDNIRAFIARYFVQSVEGDVTRLSEIGNLSGELDRILAEGFRRYIKIHEVDVPLYDKLYEEFDTLRETGRSPLEVYLGRDGIYAYIGRHSQDVARRRKLGLEGRKKLKEMGEVVEIHPQYTVYPRYFRDNLNQETKRQFLEQEGISPDADPLFYDTGYTGTIPEQIMKVMDFSQEDIEKRIRLLSAPSLHRRVKGIPENARSEIIEYIEHNAKTEETAEGLIIDEKTGKIRHIARPTNPEEQFYFMMVKQAVARHYWLQEQLHHEPSGNVNLDSEHYTIRIRQEYAKLLPSEFLQNPKEFLTQHGEMLKGSKGEGEYPDEEVVLFKMTDGTEIVAKKIELRKAKEARKEFSILISAKKAGLPTAEPVGFLSGKEDTDGSYLLMKKIEGISGRNFDKYLRDTGKFTEEKIKSILQQVAQRNKEMAELFRTTLKIDKRWRIKDTIIELNEETGEVESVVPIDWERAQNFNPATPKEIDEIA